MCALEMVIEIEHQRVYHWRIVDSWRIEIVQAQRVILRHQQLYAEAGDWM